jgi:hypothetical protein
VDYVSWIRIEDEFMMIDDVSHTATDIILTVKRGIFGSAAVAHTAGKKVMTPVYGGSKSVIKSDATYSGHPDVQLENKALRYCLRHWTNLAAEFIWERILFTFSPEDVDDCPEPLGGHNAIWCDITSSTPYGQGDWQGNQMLGWYDGPPIPPAVGADISRLISNDIHGYGQLPKVQRLRELAGPGVYFYANNTTGSAGTQSRNEDLVNPLKGGYDGGSFENYLKLDEEVISGTPTGRWIVPSNWVFVVERVMRGFANDWPLVLWERSDYDFPQQVALKQRYERFAYGSTMLAYRPGTKVSYGYTPEAPAGSIVWPRPPNRMFWDFGTPNTFPTAVASLLSGGVYRRKFSRGLVLVNATNDPVAGVALGGDYWDVTLSEHEKPSSYPATRTNTVTVPAGDAMFFLA